MHQISTLLNNDYTRFMSVGNRGNTALMPLHCVLCPETASGGDIKAINKGIEITKEVLCHSNKVDI